MDRLEKKNSVHKVFVDKWKLDLRIITVHLETLLATCEISDFQFKFPIFDCHGAGNRSYLPNNQSTVNINIDNVT